MVKGGMTPDEAIAVLKHTGKLNLLTRTIKYEYDPSSKKRFFGLPVKKVSDTTTNHITGKTHPTGGKKNKKTK